MEELVKEIKKLRLAVEKVNRPQRTYIKEIWGTDESVTLSRLRDFLEGNEVEVLDKVLSDSGRTVNIFYRNLK